VKKTPEGCLIGHFGVEKTLSMLKGKFFWPHMRKDFQKPCNRCIMPHGIYTLLPILPGWTLV